MMDIDIKYPDESGKLIGKAVLLEDGFYAFDMLAIPGFWDEYSLRWIADKLEELNAPYYNKIKQYEEEQILARLRGNRVSGNQPSARDRALNNYM